MTACHKLTWSTYRIRYEWCMTCLKTQEAAKSTNLATARCFFTTWWSWIENCLHVCVRHVPQRGRNGPCSLPTATPACLPVFPLHVDGCRWSLADTSCCLTFPSPPLIMMGGGLLPDPWPAGSSKAIISVPRGLGAALFVFESTFSERLASWRISGISRRIQSFIKGRWTIELSSRGVSALHEPGVQIINRSVSWQRPGCVCVVFDSGGCVMSSFSVSTVALKLTQWQVCGDQTILKINVTQFEF